MNRCCEDLPSIFEGARVEDIPEIKEKLIEVSTDYKHWTTTFKCKVCGQKWIERFVHRGHGEVPEVLKFN